MFGVLDVGFSKIIYVLCFRDESMDILMEPDNKYTIQINHAELLNIHHALYERIALIIKDELPDYYQERYDCVNEMLEILETVL